MGVSGQCPASIRDLGLTLQMHSKLIYCPICSTGAVVGLEQTFFRVMENVGVVELCAIVSSPDCTCPIAFPFDVILSTADGTAGKVPIQA